MGWPLWWFISGSTTWRWWLVNRLVTWVGSFYVLKRARSRHLWWLLLLQAASAASFGLLLFLGTHVPLAR